jgi:uncharacterized protein (DUF58 family)
MITVRAPVLLAVLGLVGLFTPFPWLWLGGAIGLVVLLVGADLALAAATGDLRFARAGDAQVRAGTMASVALTVTNQGARPLNGRIRDAWVPSAGASSTPPGRERVIVDSGESLEIRTELTPLRRGDRPAVRVTVRSYGPIGLAYRQTTRARSPAYSTLDVAGAAPFHSRRFLPEKLSRPRIIDGQVVTRGRGQGTEFDSLREYVVGDDIRSIDWRATARAEHVTVKTWRPERDRRVLCVLDTGRTSAARVADEPRLDAGIDAALLLAALAAHAGDRVDLLAVDTDVRASVSTGSHRTLLPTLVDAMATLEPGALGEGLMPVLPQLLSRHRVVLASVRDPALDSLAAARDTLPAIYTAAARREGAGDPRPGPHGAQPVRRTRGGGSAGHVRLRGRRHLPRSQGRRPAVAPPPLHRHQINVKRTAILARSC